MKTPLAVATFILLAACATVPVEGSGLCRTDGLNDLIGRAATSELGAEAMRRSGAERLRWIRPGDAVTMDYREDRLNVNLDSQNRVESLNCG